MTSAGPLGLQEKEKGGVFFLFGDDGFRKEQEARAEGAQYCAEGAAAGHSKDKGIGQRVPQEGLKHQASHGERKPGKPSQNNPGKSDLENNEPGRLIRAGFAENQGPQLAESHLSGSHQQGENHGNEQNRAQGEAYSQHPNWT